MRDRTTEQTVEQYRRRAEALQRRFREDVGQDVSRHRELFVRWLEQKAPAWTPATWRLYRAALSMWFEADQDPGTARAIREISTELCRPRTSVPVHRRKTSARKRKQLSPSDRASLYAALAKSTSTAAATTWLLLEAGRLTGLRPSEWKTAVLDDQQAGEIRLVIANAKNTNGRAHGDHRILHLEQLAPEDLNTVVQMLRVARAHAEDWPSLYKQCAKVMGRQCRRLWPQRGRWPSLYSGRHQFAADAKAAGFSKVEVAAMMGHGTDRTAGAHYGRKQHGRGGGFRVRPDPADVARVRVVTEAPAPTPGQAPAKPGLTPGL